MKKFYSKAILSINGVEQEIGFSMKKNENPIRVINIIPSITGKINYSKESVDFSKMIQEHTNKYIKELRDCVNREFSKALKENAEPPILEPTVEILEKAGIRKCIQVNKIWLEQKGRVISPVIEFEEEFKGYL